MRSLGIYPCLAILVRPAEVCIECHGIDRAFSFSCVGLDLFQRRRDEGRGFLCDFVRQLTWYEPLTDIRCFFVIVHMILRQSEALAGMAEIVSHQHIVAGKGQDEPGPDQRVKILPCVSVLCNELICVSDQTALVGR